MSLLLHDNIRPLSSQRAPGLFTLWMEISIVGKLQWPLIICKSLITSLYHHPEHSSTWAEKHLTWDWKRFNISWFILLPSDTRYIVFLLFWGGYSLGLQASLRKSTRSVSQPCYTQNKVCSLNGREAPIRAFFIIMSTVLKLLASRDFGKGLCCQKPHMNGQ